MSEEIQQPTPFADSLADQPVAQTTTPQIEPKKPCGRKRSILLATGVVLVLGAVVGGIFFWNQLGKPKENRQAATPSPAPSFQATAVPTKEAANSGSSGGTPLIGGSQKLLGMATAMRNLAGMLAQINQIDACLYPQVGIYVSVTDKDGKPMTNIRQSDFKIFVDDQEVKDFSLAYVGEKSVPLIVSLVIDHSGSMKGEPIEEAKKAAVIFTQLLKENDKAAVIQFDTEIELLKETTDNKDEVITAINGIVPRSDTALYDVVAFSAQDLGPCGRKAIVLLTDGRDTASKKYNLPQALDKANRTNVPVFVIGLKSYQFTPEILKQIAEGSGAQYLETPTPVELSSLYQKINEQLRQQYQFIFTLNLSKDNEEHRVRLESNVAGSTTTSEKSYIIP